MQRTFVHWSFILKSGNCWMGMIRFDLFSNLSSTCSANLMHRSNNQDSHFFLYWRNSIITTRQRSCGKVMFSLACVCSQGWGLYAWSQVSSWGWVCQVTLIKIPVLTPSGGHRSGRYASYWNDLLHITLDQNPSFLP